MVALPPRPRPRARLPDRGGPAATRSTRCRARAPERRGRRSHPRPLQRPARARPTAATPAGSWPLLGAEPAEVTLRAPPPARARARRGARGRRRGAARRRHARRARASRRAAGRRARRRCAGARPRGGLRPGCEQWAAGHPFPTCFVCGPDARRRRRHARLSRAALGDGRFAADWTPDASLATATGACGRSASGPRSTAPPARRWPTSARARRGARPADRADRRARCGSGEPHALVSWGSARDGRKREAALRAARRRGGCSRARGRSGSSCASGVSCRHGRERHLPHLSLLRGHLRPGGRRPRDARSCRSAATREDVLQPRLHLPQGAPGSSTCTTTPTGCRRRSCRRDGELRRGDLGRGASRRSTGGSRPILAEHGRDAVAVYVGNPNAHNLSALTYGPVLAARARLAERLHAPAPSTRCPSTSRPA